MSNLRIFFVVIAAAIFGLTAIAYLTAAVIVPKAAQQLEEDTKKLRHGLWEEYEAKLQEGKLSVGQHVKYPYYYLLLLNQIVVHKFL